MSTASPYPDLFEMGQQAFIRFREEFRQYGVETDPGLGLHRSQGMLCYYDFSDRQIYLSVPDLSATTGKLQLLMFRQMLCAESNEELLRFLAIFIPFIGAFIALKDKPKNPYEDFIIGAGGPIAGASSALLCLLASG